MGNRSSPSSAGVSLLVKVLLAGGAVTLAGCDQIVLAMAWLFALSLLAFVDVCALIGLAVVFLGSKPPGLVHIVLSYLLFAVSAFGVILFGPDLARTESERFHLLAVWLPICLPVLLWPVWTTAIHFHRQPGRPSTPVVAGAVLSVALLLGLGVLGRAHGRSLKALHAPAAPALVTVGTELLMAEQMKAARALAERPMAVVPVRIEKGPLPSGAPWSLFRGAGAKLVPDDVPRLPDDASAQGVIEARAYREGGTRLVAWVFDDRARASRAREALLAWAEASGVYFPKVAQNERVLVAIGFARKTTVTPTQEAARMRLVRAFEAGS